MSNFPWAVLEEIREAGGLPLLVGGAVRDMVIQGVLGDSHCFHKPQDFQITAAFNDAKDYDIEVHHMDIESLFAVLQKHGTVDLVGKAFGVLKLHDFPLVDFSVPRRDNKIGVGHKGFKMEMDPEMGIKEAARRRDLTMNSLALDLFTMQIHDPFNGVRDIKAHWLKATDPASFLEDPLRALRVAQFISRFDFRPDEILTELCRKANLAELPGERIFVEFEKLLRGRFPSLGLTFLRTSGLLKFFPELKALQGCRQDPKWHPEGDVWIHTVLAVQAAKELLLKEPEGYVDQMTVLWAVLCHDLGKPDTTKFEDGHVRSKGHEEGGIKPATEFLTRLRASGDLIAAVKALVKRHLAPAHFFGLARARGDKRDVPQAGPAAFRRLAQELSAAGTDLRTLQTVSRADHFGRTTPEAVAKQFPAGDWFLQQATNLKVINGGEKPVVQGRHLISRGFKPGPEFGAILAQCRELQDETGEKDPEKILGQVLSALRLLPSPEAA